MNPTAYQRLLDRASAFLDAAEPEAVAIAGFPVPLAANIGAIYRREVMTQNGFKTEERGTLEIRRAVLAAQAPGLGDPKSHVDIKVRGRLYRIDYTNGDTTTLRVAFSTFV